MKFIRPDRKAMTIKVGINGLGRIGRIILRTCLQNPNIAVTAVNDPAIDIEYICYLIKFDSSHGKFKGIVTQNAEDIKVDGQTIKVFHEKIPSHIPWQIAGVQYVVEASGMFTSLQKASGHLASDSVKRIIVTAPSADIPIIIFGVNEEKLKAEHKVLSCASSTLYCLAPIIKILEDHFGVAEGFITSIHAMTPSLKPLDGLCLRGKHWRDHRSIHQNIIPAATGACKALGRIIPEVKDKMTGLAFRVPIVNVSVLDITVRLKMNTSLEEIMNNIEKASKSKMQNIIKLSYEEAVSSDFIGDTHSCIVDVHSSLQLKSNFYKLICWYENEYSYACRVINSITFSENQFHQLELISTISSNRPKRFKKQNAAIQMDFLGRDGTSEVFCSVSQDSGLKFKPLIRLRNNRAIVLKKPFSSHSGTSKTAINVRDSKPGNEIFKIWNDSPKIKITKQKQNRSAFFRSCAYITEKVKKEECMKAQETLKNVKREFTKMVNITEDILKKSYCSKLKLNSQISNHKDKIEGKSIETFTLKSVEDESNISNPRGFKCNNDRKFEENNTSNTTFPNKYYKEESIPSTLSKNSNNFDSYKVSTNVSNNIINKTIEVSDKTLNQECDSNNTNNNNFRIDYIKENEKNDLKNHIAETISTFIDRLSQNILLHPTENTDGSSKKSVNTSKQIKDIIHIKNQSNKIEPSAKLATIATSIKTNDFHCIEDRKSKCIADLAKEKVDVLSPKTKINAGFGKTSNNIRIIEEELRKRNVMIMESKKDEREYGIKPIVFNSDYSQCIDDERVNSHLEFKKKTFSHDVSRCDSPDTTVTVSNCDRNRLKQDIYDKLDSTSGTDSNNSFEMNERKSQILQISDLTNSLEDLTHLDKICRIIEISDELSDQLFSALDNCVSNIESKKWSFKDLCDKIKLDEFCNRLFEKGVG